MSGPLDMFKVEQQPIEPSRRAHLGGDRGRGADEGTQRRLAGDHPRPQPTTVQRPAHAEAAGFDWLLLDLEHGAGGEEQVRATVPVAAAYGVPTVVRVESGARIRIGRVLDAGAAGVMLPRLDTVDQVRAAMTHLYYPPRGDRGVATYNRACRFGLDPGALDRANDEILGIVQIESAQAVAAAEEIAAVEGVDVLFVGPRDLSHDLGVPGLTTASVFVEALEQVRLAARKHGKACGLLVPDGGDAAAKVGEGWTFVTIGSDSTLLATAVTAQLARARTRS